MHILSIFFNMKVYCVFTLESPHRGDSNVVHAVYQFYNKKRKSAAMGCFPRHSRTSSKHPW